MFLPVTKLKKETDFVFVVSFIVIFRLYNVLLVNFYHGDETGPDHDSFHHKVTRSWEVVRFFLIDIIYLFCVSSSR